MIDVARNSRITQAHFHAGSILYMQRLLEYRMQFLPIFTEFARGVLFLFANFLKFLKQISVLLRKVIRLPFRSHCMQ
jgi:hypothetical protein